MSNNEQISKKPESDDVVKQDVVVGGQEEGGQEEGGQRVEQKVEQKVEQVKSTAKRDSYKFKYEADYFPENEKNIGILIGKKRSNLINLNTQCKEKFKKGVFIRINNSENEKTYLTIKSDIEDVIKYVIGELTKLDKKKPERFSNSYNFENISSLSKNDIIHKVESSTSILKQNCRIWLSDDGKFGYLYLKHREDCEELSKITDIIKIKDKDNSSSRGNDREKFEYNVNIKFRVTDSSSADEVRDKAYQIILDELIIGIGKHQFKLFISKEGNFGKIYIKEEADVNKVIFALNNFEQNGIEFIAYLYNKSNSQAQRQNRPRYKKFEYSLLVRNICNYLTIDEIDNIVSKLIDNGNFKVLLRMREDDSELHKGFCKILVETEEDCITLLDNLNGRGYHGTIWEVSLGKSK